MYEVAVEMSGGDAAMRDTLADGLRDLTEEATELGILAEEIYKNAATALFGHERAAARHALGTAPQCSELYSAIHRRALRLLGEYAPNGEQMRRIVELQQSASEFTRIAEQSRHIAQYALALAGFAERELERLGPDAASLLLRLVQQAYIEVRGGVLITSTRNTAMARRLLSEDAALDALYATYRAALERAIAADPRNAFPLHQLLLIGAKLEEIGNSVATICRALLFTPPPAL